MITHWINDTRLSPGSSQNILFCILHCVAFTCIIPITLAFVNNALVKPQTVLKHKLLDVVLDPVTEGRRASED